MDMSLRKLRELVVAGSLACCSHGVAKSWTRLNWTELMGFSNPELKEELTVVHTSHRCVCVPMDGSVVSFFCSEMSGIPDRLDLHSEWYLLIRVILRENFEDKWWLKSKYTACVFMYVCVNVCTCMLSRIWLFAVPWTVAHQVPLSMEFSRQDYWSG